MRRGNNFWLRLVKIIYQGPTAAVAGSNSLPLIMGTVLVGAVASEWKFNFGSGWFLKQPDHKQVWLKSWSTLSQPTSWTFGTRGSFGWNSWSTGRESHLHFINTGAITCTTTFKYLVFLEFPLLQSQKSSIPWVTSCTTGGGAFPHTTSTTPTEV